MVTKTTRKTNALEYFQPIKIFCDNKGTIDLSKNSVYHVKNKHSDLKHHVIRKLVNKSMIDVLYVVDLFTKVLRGAEHKICVNLMGLLKIKVNFICLY